MKSIVTIGSITLTVEMSSEQANAFGAYLGRVVKSRTEASMPTDEDHGLTEVLENIYAAFQAAS